MKKPKIIVIGAGYAGISFLVSLKKECFKLGDFTIINKNSYHYHSTMLHKIATAEKSGKIMFDLREFLDSEIKIIQECVVDIKDKVVKTDGGEYEYDYLVCAAGFEKETYNLEGIDNAMFIDSYIQSARICEKIKREFDSALENKTGMNIAVCGGGLTGIEFAASAINMLKQRCKFHGISSEGFDINLITSTQRLLPMFSTNMSQKTADRLKKLGVKLTNNTKIVSITPNRVNFDNGGYMDANIIVWTAGVKGNSLVSDGNIQNERGRVRVDDKLRAVGSEHLFYIGDVSAVYGENEDKPYPPTAQIAVEQGEFLAREFEAILKNQEFNEKFKFKNNGTICSVGPTYATAEVLGKDLSGYLPSILKIMVEKKWNYKLLGLKGLIL